MQYNHYQLQFKSETSDPPGCIELIYNENNKLGQGLDFARLRNKFGSDEATLENLLESIQKMRPVDETF